MSFTRGDVRSTLHRLSRVARHGRRPCGGSALLDAALVLPILLSLTFGTVEYGYFLFVKHALQGAAREGARAAIVPDATSARVRDAVIAALHSSGLNSSSNELDAKYTLSCLPGDVAEQPAATPITVTIDASWGSFNVRPLGLIGAGKSVRGTTVMRKEG